MGMNEPHLRIFSTCPKLGQRSAVADSGGNDRSPSVLLPYFITCVEAGDDCGAK